MDVSMMNAFNERYGQFLQQYTCPQHHYNVKSSTNIGIVQICSVCYTVILFSCYYMSALNRLGFFCIDKSDYVPYAPP